MEDGAYFQKSGVRQTDHCLIPGSTEGIPFFSSIVTVSLAHFIKNLVVTLVSGRSRMSSEMRASKLMPVAQARQGSHVPDELHLGWLLLNVAARKYFLTMKK